MKLQKAIRIVFAVLIVAVFLYFLLGECLLTPEHIDDAYVCTEYGGDWVHITASGTREPAEVPKKFAADRDEIVVMETTLPKDIENGRYLCFRSVKQDMRFYVDESLRLEYSTKNTRLFGRMSAAAYVFLEISEEDAGKCLRVETQTDSSYTGLFYSVYYGTPIGIWSFFFRQSGLELIVAFITLILSVLTIVCSMVLRVHYHRRVALEYLGWGILIAAVWLMTNSVFRQLVFPNLSVINDLTFLMVMLLALPYLLYMNEVQKGRYARAYQTMECLVILNFFLCCALHMTGICDFTDSIAGVAVLCVLSVILVTITLLLDLCRGRVKEYPFVAVGMLGVCVTACLQFVIYFWKISLFSGVILAVGLLFLLLFSALSTINEIIVLDREKQQALQASESKGRFLASMSHEIRTPIHAVLGMNTMILRESREPQIREYAQDIQSAGRTLLSLINDILDISRLESGKLTLHLVDYDFSSLIYDTVTMMEMKAKDKGLAFQLSVDRRTPSRLYGDDVRIRQILVNLLSNAIKYTRSGSVTLTVTTDLSGDTAALTFRVADTGIGIRKEDLEKLFCAFERLEEQKNRQIEGTGLGMSITTQLLEKMNSRLEVESVYGEGSVFSFTLTQRIMSAEPVGDLEKRIQRRAGEASYHAMFTAPQAQILIVDDNEINRRVFVNLLKATLVQVDEASGGKACLKMAKSKAYDLIFLDHMMPDMDGIAVLHTMREWKESPNLSTPVIALTANAITGAREMYLHEGFFDFLSKPIHPEKLEKMILSLLPEEKIVPGGTCAEEQKDAADAAWPELEGIDWNYAQLYCKDAPLLFSIVSQFYASLEAEAAHLERLFAPIADTRNSDVQALRLFRVQAHSMKNSAAMAGAVSLSGLAKILEFAARDGRADVIQTITPVFLQEWRKMKTILTPVVPAKDDTRDAPKANAALVNELLTLLKNALSEMDVDTADELLRQLKRFAYPDASAGALEQLSLAVLNLDDGQAVEWGGRLLASLQETTNTL